MKSWAPDSTTHEGEDFLALPLVRLRVSSPGMSRETFALAGGTVGRPCDNGKEEKSAIEKLQPAPSFCGKSLILFKPKICRNFFVVP
jgi:hypothetical protein